LVGKAVVLVGVGEVPALDEDEARCLRTSRRLLPRRIATVSGTRERSCSCSS